MEKENINQLPDELKVITYTLPSSRFNDETKKELNLTEENNIVYLAELREDGTFGFTTDINLAYKLIVTDNIMAAMTNTFAQINDLQLKELIGKKKN